MMDTLEHLERQVADSISLGEHLTAAEHITLLVKHCIADEAAKAAAAKQPEPDGDVPEWLADYERSYIDGCDTKAIWDECQKYAARRVAEATQRIIDSYGMTAKCFEESRDKWKAFAENRLADCADKDKRIAELEATNKSLLDGRREIRQELIEAKQQLAAAQAEVERVRKFADSMEDELTKLREENARLSRPVSGSPEWTLAGQYIPDVPVVSYETLKIERNAREAAEAERDELREACKRFFPCRNHVGVYEGHRRCGDVPDIAIDAVLAAHRAEKGKVTK